MRAFLLGDWRARGWCGGGEKAFFQHRGILPFCKNERPLRLEWPILPLQGGREYRCGRAMTMRFPSRRWRRERRGEGAHLCALSVYLAFEGRGTGYFERACRAVRCGETVALFKRGRPVLQGRAATGTRRRKAARFVVDIVSERSGREIWQRRERPGGRGRHSYSRKGEGSFSAGGALCPGKARISGSFFQSEMPLPTGKKRSGTG